LLAAAALVLASCGDDGDTDEASAVTTGPPADSAAGSEASIAAYCQGHLDANAAATAAEFDLDPTVDVDGVFAEWVEASPAAIRSDVETATSAFAAGDVESPEFGQAYDAVVTFTRENCGFGELAVTATEYSFAGIPETIEAGPAVVAFENDGNEIHHIIMIQVNDGVTESPEELLEELFELPEDEVPTKVSLLGETFALPGEDGAELFDLQPGRHFAVCVIPTGTTPDSPPPGEGTDPPGPPHFVHGMIQEFTVEA